MLQTLRVLLKHRVHFHNHVILIQAGVHGRYLALSESVVEGVIDLLSRDSQTARSGSINLQRSFQAVILLIAVDVRQCGQRSELANQSWCPVDQISQVVALNRVLKLRVGRAASDAYILDGL